MAPMSTLAIPHRMTPFPCPTRALRLPPGGGKSNAASLPRLRPYERLPYTWAIGSPASVTLSKAQNPERLSRDKLSGASGITC